MCDWWRDRRRRQGRLAVSAAFLGELAAFLRQSTPAIRRQRFGDAAYDWDYRVNTMSAGVPWRERLLGHFHSPYQPTDPAVFHEMLTQLPLDVSQFTFLDLGSGKGRTLLLAADYPFAQIVGVELLPKLHRIAVDNIGVYQSIAQRCFAIESICGDARDFTFPPAPTVLYLFNPFLKSTLEQVLRRLEQSLRQHPRPVVVLYHNPQLTSVLEQSGIWTKRATTEQWAIYSAGDSHKQKL
jgi:SAM-dependent methyltransferase